jgi:hypothetical protein
MSTDIPSAGELNDRVSAAVRSHRTKIRALTALAFLFGFLAIAASVVIVFFYLIFYLPKQKQLLHDAEVAVQQAKNNPSTGEASLEKTVKRIDQFLGAQIVMTHVTSIGTTMVAVMVGILGLGTLVLLSVVVLNRRITLSQINLSLAQISTQLRELRPS